MNRCRQTYYGIFGFLAVLVLAWIGGFNFDERGRIAVGVSMLAILGFILGAFIGYIRNEIKNPSGGKGPTNTGPR